MFGMFRIMQCIFTSIAASLDANGTKNTLANAITHAKIEP